MFFEELQYIIEGAQNLSQDETSRLSQSHHQLEKTNLQSFWCLSQIQELKIKN
jgi:hypothetical protein